MRICYLANAASPHTAKWAEHFSAQGHEVHVISFDKNPALSPKIILHRLEKALPFKLDYFSAGRRVRRLVTQIKPDILHAHYASGYGTLARLGGFHPYLLSVWGSDVFEFPRRSPFHSTLLRRNLDAADGLSSTSRVLAAETSKYTEKPVNLGPFGVDCEQFKPNDALRRDSGEFVIGTVKSLEESSGIENLLEAFKLLCEKHPEVNPRLVIIGGGTRDKKCRGVARQLGLDGRVTFTGPVPHGEIPRYLKGFSAFALLPHAESFGVAVLEASACGLPVVVPRVGGLPEVVRDGLTGIMVAPGNTHEAADKLFTLAADSELRRRLGRSGRAFVLQNYEWDEHAKRMERLYESMLLRTANERLARVGRIQDASNLRIANEEMCGNQEEE